MSKNNPFHALAKYIFDVRDQQQYREKQLLKKQSQSSSESSHTGEWTLNYDKMISLVPIYMGLHNVEKPRRALSQENEVASPKKDKTFGTIMQSNLSDLQQQPDLFLIEGYSVPAEKQYNAQ
jgi:hypothetical protein